MIISILINPVEYHNTTMEDLLRNPFLVLRTPLPVLIDGADTGESCMHLRLCVELENRLQKDFTLAECILSPGYTEKEIAEAGNTMEALCRLRYQTP